MDDHQTLNAQFLVDAQAGVIIAERDLTPTRLAEGLQKLLQGGREQLGQMAMRARDASRSRMRMSGSRDARVAAAGGVR